MGALALEGFWLLAAFAVVYLVGVFTAQWAKDKINGVPGTLRNALRVTEAAALKELTDARDRLVADTASLIAKGRAVVSAEIKAADKAAPVATAVESVRGVEPVRVVVDPPKDAAPLTPGV